MLNRWCMLIAAAQQTELIGAIQQQVGDNGVVTQVAGPGRKLLDVRPCVRLLPNLPDRGPNLISLNSWLQTCRQ